MQRNVRGNSIIEVMIVMLVLTTGIVGAYKILTSGRSLATTTENRIKAVNIAREGIEAVENIRNTNWIKFSSDYNGCYDTANYNALCIGTGSGGITSGSYILAGLPGGAWTLSGVTTTAIATGSSRATYLTSFPVYFDINGLITQTGTPPSIPCAGSISRNCRSIFSREIRITRPIDRSTIEVESVVTWGDNTRAEPYTISLKHSLTNWKYQYYQK